MAEQLSQIPEADIKYGFEKLLPEILKLPETPQWFKELSQQKEYKNSFIIEELVLQSMYVGWDNLAAAILDIDGTQINVYKPTQYEKDTLSSDELRALIIKKTQPYADSLARFAQNLARRHRPLIPISGRSEAEIANGQPGGRDHDIQQLPQYPARIAAVGTHIDVLQRDGTYMRDEEWYRYIKDTIGFDRDVLYKAATELISEMTDVELEFQPKDRVENVEAFIRDPQNLEGRTEQAPQELKISFWWKGTADMIPQVASRIKEKLASIHKEAVQVVISHDAQLEGERYRYNIDLVPVTKGDAINYMRKKLGLRWAAVAGDSGNDLELIKQGDIAAVVGGAKPDLTSALQSVIDGAQPTRRPHELHILNQAGNLKGIYMNLRDSRIGPETLERALHYFELLDAFIKAHRK